MSEHKQNVQAALAVIDKIHAHRASHGNFTEANMRVKLSDLREVISALTEQHEHATPAVAQERKEEYDNQPFCKYCNRPIAIRNPTGNCDHLYYPDNVNKNYPKPPISTHIKGDFSEPIVARPILCSHANEVPAVCKCPNDCYCKSNTCKQISGFLKEEDKKLEFGNDVEIKLAKELCDVYYEGTENEDVFKRGNVRKSCIRLAKHVLAKENHIASQLAEALEEGLLKFGNTPPQNECKCDICTKAKQALQRYKEQVKK